jgi:hypothetical protein
MMFLAVLPCSAFPQRKLPETLGREKMKISIIEEGTTFKLSIDDITHEQQMRLFQLATEIVQEKRRVADEQKRQAENVYGDGI